jgi:hypothetical protein
MNTYNNIKPSAPPMSLSSSPNSYNYGYGYEENIYYHAIKPTITSPQQIYLTQSSPLRVPILDNRQVEERNNNERIVTCSLLSSFCCLCCLMSQD